MNIFKLTILAGIVVSGIATAPAARAYDRHIELINESHSAITSFFTADAGSDHWEGDLLGNGALPPGYEVRVTVDDGTRLCRVDLKTTFVDGSTVIRRNVDVCSIAKYTLKD